jgi:hypothetical protein
MVAGRAMTMTKELKELYGSKPARREHWNLHAPRHGLAQTVFDTSLAFFSGKDDLIDIVAAWDDRRTKYKIVLLRSDRSIVYCSIQQLKALL